MRPQYPNVAKVELVAQALGDLREKLRKLRKLRFKIPFDRLRANGLCCHYK
jgi:hypothetical protein